MKNKRDSYQNQDSDEKSQKKRLVFLSSLVILLTIITFAMGAALIALFINQRKIEQAKVDEISTSTPSPEASVIPSPQEAIVPSPEVIITPSPLEKITPLPEVIVTPTPEVNTTSTPEITTGEVTITPTPEVTTAAVPKPTTANPKSFEYQGLLFELQQCQKLNVNAQTQSIKCSVAITSTQENVKVELYSAVRGNENRRSRILDAGQESIARKIQFGSDVTQWGRTKNNLIKDVPMKAIFMFENVPLETDEIDVFEITSSMRSSYYNNDIKVEFRNVNVSDS